MKHNKGNKYENMYAFLGYGQPEEKLYISHEVIITIANKVHEDNVSQIDKPIVDITH